MCNHHSSLHLKHWLAYLKGVHSVIHESCLNKDVCSFVWNWDMNSSCLGVICCIPARTNLLQLPILGRLHLDPVAVIWKAQVLWRSPTCCDQQPTWSSNHGQEPFWLPGPACVNCYCLRAQSFLSLRKNPWLCSANLQGCDSNKLEGVFICSLGGRAVYKGSHVSIFLHFVSRILLIYIDRQQVLSHRKVFLIQTQTLPSVEEICSDTLYIRKKGKRVRLLQLIEECFTALGRCRWMFVFIIKKTQCWSI